MNTLSPVHKLLWLFIGIFLLLLSSCITNRQVKLLQEAETDSIATFYANEKDAYLIQPYNNLYIKLTSSDAETNQVLNISDEIRVSSGSGAASRFKDVYLVNDSGYVDIPPIGLILVKNLTLDQAKKRVMEKANTYYRDVGVVIRLADYNITVLGEVNNPGRYEFYKDKITIFEAIGCAGDLTRYANRRKIAVIRQLEEGSEVFYVDLTRKNVLASEYYFLMPDDFVYVEPLRQTFWQSDSFPFFSSLTLLLSTTTSILVILSYLK